jgi:excinuclease ABC subunit C
LAKEKDPSLRKEEGKGVDKIYLPQVKDPILLPAHSFSLRTLQQIRDEAHRFALVYHKKLRRKQGLQTILDEVPGIGEVKKKALFKHFGSLQKIQEASAATLSQVDPLLPKDARTIFSFFHPQGEGQI